VSELSMAAIIERLEALLAVGFLLSMDPGDRE
jgi:hypothetical protein